MTRGAFIVIEGADASGKSTQAARLVQRLAPLPVVDTYEPTAGPVGAVIRNMLVGAVTRPTDPLAFQELYVADRREHVATVIEPALAAGRVVVCDRYSLSTLAYAFAAGDVLPPVRRWRQGVVAAMHAGILPPDLTVVLDVPDEVAIERLRAKRGADVHERDAALQARVRDTYRMLVGPGVVLVPADGDEDTVAERVWAAVAPVLARRHGLT